MPKLTMSMTPYAMQRTAAYREQGSTPAPYTQDRRLGPPHYTDGQIVKGGAANAAYGDRLWGVTGTPVRFPPAGQAWGGSPPTVYDQAGRWISERNLAHSRGLRPGWGLDPTYGDQLWDASRTVRFPPAGQAASPYTTVSSYTRGPTLLAAGVAFAAGYAAHRFLVEKGRRGR